MSSPDLPDWHIGQAPLAVTRQLYSSGGALAFPPLTSGALDVAVWQSVIVALQFSQGVVGHTDPGWVQIVWSDQAGATVGLDILTLTTPDHDTRFFQWILPARGSKATVTFEAVAPLSDPQAILTVDGSTRHVEAPVLDHSARHGVVTTYFGQVLIPAAGTVTNDIPPSQYGYRVTVSATSALVLAALRYYEPAGGGWNTWPLGDVAATANDGASVDVRVPFRALQMIIRNTDAAGHTTAWSVVELGQ